MATGLLSADWQGENFYTAYLTADCTAGDTDIFLDIVPANSEGTLVIDPDSTTNREIIYYNSKTATKVTCPANGRGYDNSTASAHTTGTKVIMAPIADWFNSLKTLFTTTPQGWSDLADVPDSVTYNGNRSYDLVFNSNDLTDTVSNGMRVKLTRTVTPPTQCTDLEASSSQYWSKTSPAGISFTDDFTLAAWIKVESYATTGFIIARNSVAGTNGFRLYVNTSGQITADAFISAGNSKLYNTYQSVPIGKWVHVAATVDMSGNVGTIYLDGVSVPVQTTATGTANSLTQAGNLYIGTQVGTTSYFDGKIAQASVHNAILTANQIRDMASQTISSSSPSIVSGFTFNGAATDVTANANDLTASGGATYGTDSPMNATEYGIITANSFSTNTTLTVQVPEGYSIPTSGGVSSVFYSTQHTPYGFPANRGKWKIESMYLANLSQSAPVTGTWYSLNTRITVPTGAWTGTYMANVYGDNGGTPNDIQISMGTSSNSEQDSYMTYRCFENSATSGIWPVNKSREYNLTSATDHYIVAKENSGILTTLQLYGTDGATVIRFELAYI